MLCKINGTAPEDYGKAISEQTHAPDFDLVVKLKARRLRWLRHVLRMPETSLLRRVVLRHGTTDLPEGTIFDDAPEHASTTINIIARVEDEDRVRDPSDILAKTGVGTRQRGRRQPG
jgi:hypothetical protein